MFVLRTDGVANQKFQETQDKGAAVQGKTCISLATQGRFAPAASARISNYCLRMRIDNNNYNVGNNSTYFVTPSARQTETTYKEIQKKHPYPTLKFRGYDFTMSCVSLETSYSYGTRWKVELDLQDACGASMVIMCNFFSTEHGGLEAYIYEAYLYSCADRSNYIRVDEYICPFELADLCSEERSEEKLINCINEII